MGLEALIVLDVDIVMAGTSTRLLETPLKERQAYRGTALHDAKPVTVKL
jgi:hypothetical protein